MKQQPKDLAAMLTDKHKVEGALRGAVRDALVRHKMAGNPVAVWQMGKVVWLQPEEIPVVTEKSA